MIMPRRTGMAKPNQVQAGERIVAFARPGKSPEIGPERRLPRPPAAGNIDGLQRFISASGGTD
jgi:hypothetical protein